MEVVILSPFSHQSLHKSGTGLTRVLVLKNGSCSIWNKSKLLHFGYGANKVRLGVCFNQHRSSSHTGEQTIVQNIVKTSMIPLIMLAACSSGAALAESRECTSFAGQDINTLVVIACVAEAIALTGAAVGGIIARQRKVEVENINAQLRQIFAKMRRQYQVESYAPSLTYAPVTGFGADQIQSDPMKMEMVNYLKAGKRFLREKKPKEAFDEFEKALPLARQLKDPIEEKKAIRGLGASCQRQGKYKEAIRYHSMILTICHLTGDKTGYTEALGAIADCYTELGDLETAAKYYDRFIERMDGVDE